MPRKKIDAAAEDAAASALKRIVTTPEEEAEDLDRLESMNTRGKQGLKLPRINAAFTPTNCDYLHVMAALKGYTVTQYLNQLVQDDRERNAEQYKKAKELMDELRD